jgi:hypothetical protein
MRNGVAVFAITLVVVSAGCGPKHHLKEYQFADKSIAFAYIAPPAPVLRTAGVDLDSDDHPVLTAMKVGTNAAKEMEARKARVKLDSALSRVDFATSLTLKTLERASRYLGTKPVSSPDNADYILEVTMRRLGIDVSGETSAYLFTNAETVLLDRRTGREIWSVTVKGTDRLTPSVQGASGVPGGILTAGTLNSVTAADFEHALNQLALLSSNVIADALRSALRDAREK